MQPIRDPPASFHKEAIIDNILPKLYPGSNYNLVLSMVCQTIAASYQETVSVKKTILYWKKLHLMRDFFVLSK